MKYIVLVCVLMLFSRYSNIQLNSNNSNKDIEQVNNIEKATFAAGCFWGVELKFSKLNGVISTRVGYMGGKLENPTYKDVCYNQTGHAEVCEVVFNPEIISYKQLVESFFKFHDPTQLNRQGPDIGDQYRSAIFYYDDVQLTIAKDVIADLNLSKFGNKIVTKLEKSDKFWDAEEYHQKYLEKRGVNSCGF